jgi:dipeptidyl aminopeptidase/acylaminoacyl peptidase
MRSGALLLASALLLPVSDASASPTLLSAPSASASPGAMPTVETVFESIQRVRRFHDVALSPDGGRVAWSEKAREAGGPSTHGEITIADLSSGSTRRLTAGGGSRALRERGAAFSPDGRTVAFLSDAADPGQLQIWLARAAGGPPSRLTNVRGQLDQLIWSPDGKEIAFLFVEGSTQETGALVPYKPDSGVVAESIEEQRIAIADARTGAVRMVSPADLYVYDYDWSPDGRAFAAEAAKGSGTNNYWIAELYRIDAVTGEAKSIWKPPLQIGCPRFSPDGKSVAVIHGLMSDQGHTGGDVWLVPATGAVPKNLTPGMKATAGEIFWRPDGVIVATGYVDGQMGIGTIDPGNGRIHPIWASPEKIQDFCLAGDGKTTALVRESFGMPPEVWVGSIGHWKKATSLNAGTTAWWGEAKSLHWKSDGVTIQGWLVYPLGFDRSRRYPMVVSVHGGPSSAQSIGWPEHWNAVLPSQGYFVFLANPRGSYGFGEFFTQSNVKDFGGGDLRDILSGVDEAVSAAPVDPDRIGICGWSYGGYMTMWAVTQTNRFRAAVAGAGIASWQSYYGQNRIDTWMLPFFGASVYDDPKVYAKSSPIEFIKNVRTPTLVLHGDRDSEVPTPQGYEFWHALKTLGVPTQLVIYTDEGHSFRKAEDLLDRDRRVAEWFDRYLK